MVSEEWRAKYCSWFIYQRILIGSFAFIFIVLSFDCWFQNLPLSGYGIIFLSLLVASCSSLAFCHAFHYFLYTQPSHSTENACWHWLAQKILLKEKTVVDKIFQIKIPSLTYPTSLNEQMRLLLKDIERDYVKPWYAEISPNPSFLFECHLVLEEVLFKILAKLKCCDFKMLIKNILFLYLSHLQEIKRSLRRCDKAAGETVTIEKMYRFGHPASSSDEALNHYLSQIMMILVREYAPHDLVSSVESSILTRILARKMLKTLIVNIEDPAWIYIRILYLIDNNKYSDIMKGASYNIKEITEKEPIVSSHKFRMKPALLSRKTELGDNIFNRTLGSKAFLATNSLPTDKNVLNLQLVTARPEPNISSVLGNLIQSTAAPLLPENASLCYQPLNKMWLSPVTELKQEITDSLVNPVIKTLTEGISECKGNGLKERFLLSRSKVLTRSKSSDAMSCDEELNPPLVQRDISVGEELSEGVGEEIGRRLVKTQSFDAGSCGDLPEGGDGDVSPVYEEPEDFATTIAKLRNVLQQRESTSTLSDKSVQSLDSQDMLCKENTIDSCDKGLSMDEGTAGDSQLACDIPSDGRPFVNISIPSTEIKESSSTAYVLYTIQYDGIYMKPTEEGESQLVLQTTIVKRRFQEFLNLQNRLEDDPALRPFLKGVKGPTKWLTMPFGTKTDDSTTSTRRPVLEKYLQQLCERLEIASSAALQEFLAYRSNAVSTFHSSNSNSSILKIDKFLTNKVTGVFNSIKTVLPSFEANAFATIDGKEVKEGKPSVEQNLLHGFLNFGNKPEDVQPIQLSFVVTEATGEALTDNIRHLLAEKSDCIEDALDVLDSCDWHTEAGECHLLTSNGNCVWAQFRDALIDDDVDKFDGEAPVSHLMLDILCELLEDNHGWITKQPVFSLLKVISVRLEKLFQDRLVEIDWDRVCANLVRLMRAALFVHQSVGSVQLEANQVQKDLLTAILAVIPEGIIKLVGEKTISDAVIELLNSVGHSKWNRDVILKLCDLLLSQLLSCPHLQSTSKSV